MIFEHEPEEFKVHQIILADADGKNERVIFSSTETWVWSPKISPDGSKILVTYGDVNEIVRGRKAKLGWIPIDGGEITQIGKSNWNLLDLPLKFEWLRDGSGIVFNSKQTSDEYGQIYLITFPTGELRRINNDANLYLSLSATADGKTLASIKKTASSGIWEFEIQTNGFKQVSPSSAQHNGVLGIAVSNDKILFVRPNENGNKDLWQMNLDGTSEKILVSQKGSIETPIISANGNFCYFTTNANLFSESFPENAIWRMNIDGSNLTKLTSANGVLQLMLRSIWF